MLSVALLLGLLTWQAWDEFRAAERRLGGFFEQTGEGMEVLGVDPGLALDRAGVEVGDVLLTLGGQRAGDLLALTRAQNLLEAHRPTELTILRDGDTLRVPVRPGGGGAPWLTFTLNALTAFAYLALSALAFLQKGRDVRADLLGWFSLAVAVELAMPFGWIDPWALLVSPALFYLLTGAQIGLELHLLSLIPDRPAWLKQRPWIVPGYYSAGLVVGVIPAAAFLLYLLAPEATDPALLTRIEDVFFAAVFPVWAVAVLALLLPRAVSHPEPRGRQQAGLVLVGVAPWVLNMLAGSVAEALGWVPPPWAANLENLTLLCFPVAVFAAIFRAHLFDLERVVRRSLVYGLLTGALVLVFYGVLGAGGALFSGWIGGGSSVWAVSLATLALGLLFSPLRRGVQRLIERRFFPERRAMRQRLIELADELPSRGRLSHMTAHLSDQLEGIFAASYVTLWVAEPRGEELRPADEASETPILCGDAGLQALRKARTPQPASNVLEQSPPLRSRESLRRAAVLAPLVRRDQLVGLLVLGPKNGGDRYPAEELELLSLFSHHVATVLENARLFESATIESLTGLLRRETILEKIGRELERARRYDRPMTLALLDLDHFKEINDRYGHLAGDHLLRHLSRAMADDLRTTDALGRYGGEEFLLLLPETDADGAWTVAEKLRRRVEELEIPMEDGTKAGVTVSIGLASRRSAGDDLAGATSEAVRDLLAEADRALYLAKRNGRNQVQPVVEHWVARA